METLLTLLLVIVFIHTSMEKKQLQSTSPALCGLTLAAGIISGFVLPVHAITIIIIDNQFLILMTV